MANYIFQGQTYTLSPGTISLYGFEKNGNDLAGGPAATFVGNVSFPLTPQPFQGNYWIQSALPSVTGTVGSVTFPNANVNPSQGTVELAFCTGWEVTDSQVIFASGGTHQSRALEFNINGTGVLCYGVLNGLTAFNAGVVVPNTRYYMAITWGPNGTSWYFGPIADDNSVNPQLLFNTSTLPDWGTVNNVYLFQSFNSISNFVGAIDWVRFSNIQRTSFPTMDSLVPQNRAIFMGQEITGMVTQWDQIEQIKDVLLADAQFVSSELNLTVDNSSGAFSPLNSKSLIQGSNWYNQELQILFGNTLIFDGLVKNIQISPDDHTATLVAENVLSGLTDAIVTTAQPVTGVNPGSAMLGILVNAGLGQYLDQASFYDAGGPALAANATIDYNFDQGSNTTALAAVQGIASLASISIFVENSTIVAKAFQPYQGMGSGLRFEIGDSLVRTWSQYQWDTDSFNNQVSVGYTSGASVAYYTASNQASITQDRVTRLYEFGGSDAVAHNLASAQFFAQSYLARASMRRGILDLTAGPEFANSVLGDRHWVTNSGLGLNRFPMEIIEIHHHLDTDDVDLRLVALSDSNDA